MPLLTATDRSLLANTADILKVDIKVNDRYKLSGKGAVKKQLFGDVVVPLVPKILQGRVYSNYGDAIIVTLSNVVGSLFMLLLVEPDLKNPAEFDAHLHLLDGSKLDLQKKILPTRWSRKIVYQRLAPMIKESYVLHSADADTWGKLDDRCVDSYLSFRKDGHSSDEALVAAGMRL